MSAFKELEFCISLFQENDFSSEWIEKTNVSEIIRRVSENIERDINDLEDNASFIFNTGQRVDSHTKTTISLFRDWAISGACPSLTALCYFAMDKFAITDEKLRNFLTVASILGEIENPLPYHNNMHFRKVVFQCMRMVAVYNDIYAGTSRAFDEDSIALMLGTACIHDFGHDGKGYVMKGVYIPHRLELISYESVAPIFKKIDMSDDQLKLMKAMLVCTDVTPFNDPANGLNQAKSAYRYHFLGAKSKTVSLNLDDELTILEKSAEAAAMALMLHEADIGTSAGLHYDMTKYETCLLRMEIADGVAQPQNIINFLEDICNRQMLSEVGQQLFAANMARIYALAEQDAKNGNEPFPEIDQSDFILGVKSKDYVQGSKSVN